MATTKWFIDPVHSEIKFRVRHMMITNVTGTFDEFTAELISKDGGLIDASVVFEAKVASINTRNSQRDGHLRSNDFFETDKFPLLKFRSKKIIYQGNNLFQMIGDFELKGIKKEMTFEAKKLGEVLDSWGKRRVGYSIEGVINRSDFDLLWNAPTEDGGVALAEEVFIIINVQMIKAD